MGGKAVAGRGVDTNIERETRTSLVFKLEFRVGPVGFADLGVLKRKRKLSVSTTLMFPTSTCKMQDYPAPIPLSHRPDG